MVIKNKRYSYIDHKLPQVANITNFSADEHFLGIRHTALHKRYPWSLTLRILLYNHNVHIHILPLSYCSRQKKKKEQEEKDVSRNSIQLTLWYIFTMIYYLFVYSVYNLRVISSMGNSCQYCYPNHLQTIRLQLHHEWVLSIFGYGSCVRMDWQHTFLMKWHRLMSSQHYLGFVYNGCYLRHPTYFWGMPW